MQHRNRRPRPRRLGRALAPACFVLALSGALFGCDDDDPALTGDFAADTGTAADGDTLPGDGGTDAEPPRDGTFPDQALDDLGVEADEGPDAFVTDGSFDADAPRLDAALDGGEIRADAEADAETDATVDAEVDLGPEPDAGPQDRCAAFDGLQNAELVAALHTELHDTYRPLEVDNDLGGNPNRYTTARAIMFTRVEYITREDGSSGVECAYTGRFFVEPPGVEPADEDVNCEHTWPRSRMSARDTRRYSHQQSDLHHLQPTLPGANSMRGNFPFGEPVSDRNLNYVPAVLGRDSEGRQVFSPRAERRGDVARMIFYFNVRWGIDLPDFEEAVLKDWAAIDPVEPRERDRNDRVEQIQGNRNPFVDCPQLVSRIADFAAFQSIDTDANLPAP